MLGKVHAWGPDRDTAVARLAGALDDLVLEGVPTTAPYLRSVLDRPEHGAMAHDTGSVERDWSPDPGGSSGDLGERSGYLGGSDRDRETGEREQRHPDRPHRHRSRPARTADPRRPGAHVATSAASAPSSADAAPEGVDGSHAPARPRSSQPGPATAAAGDPVAPMDATVVEVAVEPGQHVDAGGVLVVLEAMKMELPVRAPHAVRVDAVHVAAGDRVGAGSILVAVSAPERAG